jgi:hypothetical protein
MNNPMYPTLQESYEAMVFYRVQLDAADALLDMLYANPELAQHLPEGVAA